MTSIDKLEISGSLDGRNYLAELTMIKDSRSTFEGADEAKIYLWEGGNDITVVGGNGDSFSGVYSWETLHHVVRGQQALGYELTDVDGVPAEHLPPMPVERLVRQAVDDASDYDDGVDGYTGHRFDRGAGVLELYYERREGDLEGGSPDYLHGPAEYRFQLLEIDPDSVQGPTIEHLCEVMHDAYEKAALGAGWETQEASRKPWAEVPETNKQTMRAAVTVLLGEIHS